MIETTRQSVSRAGGVDLPPVHLRRHRILIPAFILAFILLLTGSQNAAAHAALETSSLASGEVVSSAPTEVSVSFTERLDRSYSRLDLYDQSGALVEGTTLVDGADEYTMLLRLPANLVNGTYSILWRTLSRDDGHTAQNYFAFTVGSDLDIVTVVAPSTSLDAGDAPQWAKAASRWLALIGLAALVAIWPIWSIVIRPALGSIWNVAPIALPRAQRYAGAAVIAAVAGSLIALIVQALALSDGSIVERILNTLGQTRYGRLSLLRFGLFLALGLLLSTCAWWFRRNRKGESIVAWVVTFALPIPFSLISHAYAQGTGRNVAVLADYAHTLGFSIWFGGLLMVLIVLIPVLRLVDVEQRRSVLRIALPRFSVISLICWGVLGLTGLYAGWLHVGNLNALTSTDYGRSLIVKLIFLAVVLILAAINLLFVSKRIAREVDRIWQTRLTWLVTAEVALVLLAVLAVGQMTSLQPARDQIVEDAQQVTVPFDLNGRSARLLVAPGITGANHLRLEVSGEGIPTSTVMLLRVTIPERADLGTQEITLSRVARNAFEHHGSELSIAGTWQLTLIERVSGASPNEAKASLELGTTRSAADVPGNPWRFEALGGATGLILLLVGIAGLVLAWFAGKTPARKESGGLALVAIALGVVLLFQARIDPLLVNARGGSTMDTSDLASIERGQDLYQNYCMSCHGIDLRGDGPDGAGLDPPPADFTAEHTMVHSDSDLIYWTKNGKQGTGMPGFANMLSDQDILNVLTFIASRQETTDAGSTTPRPEACTAEPLTLDALTARANGSGSTAPDPVIASNPLVDPAVASSVLDLGNQFVACTNAADTMRRLALFSDRQLIASFPNGIDAGFKAAATTTPQPLPEEQWLFIAATPIVSLLIDGRVMITTAVSGPDAASGTTLNLIMVQKDGGWLIDEIR